MKYSIVIVLTIMVFSACEEEKIPYTSCELYVRYEEDGKKILAEAKLFEKREDDRLVKFTPEGNVTFMGSHMESQLLDRGEVRYALEYTGNLPDALPLGWPVAKGKEMTVSFEPVPISDFSLSFAEDQYTLEMDAPPLGEDENMVLLFTDNQDQMHNFKTIGPSEDARLTFAKSTFGRLPTGPAQLSLVRTRSFNSQQTDCDCRIVYSYYTREKEVTIQ